jgi:hypothetical protein
MNYKNLQIEIKLTIFCFIDIHDKPKINLSLNTLQAHNEHQGGTKKQQIVDCKEGTKKQQIVD